MENPNNEYNTAGIETPFDFGQAIKHLKAGKKVTRAGWNGKGMWIYLVPANNYPAQTEAAQVYWGDKGVGVHVSGAPLVPYGAYIAMKTSLEIVLPWIASQSDMLSEDWTIADG